MQRFQFRLERLLKLKQQREWLGELRRQKARLALEAARGRVGALNEELVSVARSLQDGLVPTDRWPAAYAHSARLGRDLVTAEADAAQAERRLAEATAERTRLAREVETLLHLRGRDWQAHKEETLSAEQRRVDELSMQRWQASRADGSAAPEGEGS